MPSLFTQTWSIAVAIEFSTDQPTLESVAGRVHHYPDAALVLGQAREFAQRFAGLQRFITAWRPTICPLERLVECVPKNSRVLDIGCGTGLFLFLLARNNRILSGEG